jgi:hypothetical protein
VGDGGAESQVPPPDGPLVVEPELVEELLVDGEDLRRADEPIPADAGQTVWNETIGRMPHT